jgi:hypothetical protein
MSNASVKVAIALFMVLATPAASFARGGGGGGGGRGGGSSAMGNLGGSRPNAGAQISTQQMLTDPSGVGNASRVAPIAPPRISVPTVPQFK